MAVSASGTLAGGKERDRIRTAKTPFFDDQTVLLADGKTLVTIHQGGDSDVVHIRNLAAQERMLAP